jgi:hypothetical protein
VLPAEVNHLDPTETFCETISWVCLKISPSGFSFIIGNDECQVKVERRGEERRGSR